LHPGWLCILLCTGGALTGCNQPQAAPPSKPPPAEVKVSHPVIKEVTDYEDFPGRIEAINSIEVRARVTGYLDKVNFDEGSEVKQGDVLFEIDARPYQAELNRAEANLVQAEAHLKRLNADYQRAVGLLPKGAMGREEFDKITGDRAEASAAVGVAKASKDLAQLNLGFTKVRAPIGGRISRRFIDPGNMVKADDSPLTNIVSLDPIHAYFDVDERTTLRLQRLIRSEQVQWSQGGGVRVLLGLADEDGFSQEGTINFSDNKVDADTGTWRLRGIFANPKRILSPGLFVRIRLPIGRPYSALLVSEQALGADQGKKFVYVVDANNAVRYRDVQVGRLHDGLRVIAKGLTKDELVVVSGLQRIRDGATVKPEPVEMPVLTASLTQPAPESAGKPSAADVETKRADPRPPPTIGKQRP
jgi:RND family efflux transporter MFP subunit